jgi:hypothetical protein
MGMPLKDPSDLVTRLRQGREGGWLGLLQTYKALCEEAAVALEAKDPTLPGRLAHVLCRSNKFETGEGTCAAICMDQLGDPRGSMHGCRHAAMVHRELSEKLAAEAEITN